MSNPKCVACDHINRVGAATCEMCDARLGDPGETGTPPGETFHYSGAEPHAGEEPHAGALPTDIPSTPFKGAGDVISPTLEIYRKNFPLVGILVLVTTLPVAFIQYGAAQAMMSKADDAISGGLDIGYQIWEQLFVKLLAFVGSALLSSALVYAVIELRRTGVASASESLRRGLKSLPKVFIVTLLYTIVVGVGYILLIVPGIIFSLMYPLVVPVAVAENLGPIEAFNRSAGLTDGYKWLIFITYFLWTLLIGIVSLIVTLSFMYAGAKSMLPVLLIDSLIGAMLNSSTTVLAVFIYLGILNEERHGFDTRVFTHAPDTAAR
jgi:uncharacterized membrane protein